jgi:hypothetical protein
MYSNIRIYTYLPLNVYFNLMFSSGVGNEYLLLIAMDCNVKGLAGLQWHKYRSKFSDNWTANSKIKIRRVMETLPIQAYDLTG